MSISAIANIELEETSHLIDLFKDGIKQHGLEFKINAKGVLSCPTPLGMISLLASDNSIELKIEADTQDKLYILQQEITEYLTSFDTRLEDKFNWNNKTYEVGSYPPNLHETTVVSCEKVSPSFYRLVVHATDVHRLAVTAIHCRLMLPAIPSAKVVWPTIDEKGKTIWPKGEDKLHNPVYTIRSIDIEQGLIDFDIFIHDGGRTYEWAKTLKKDTKLAMIGPVGSFIPQADWMLLSGDETAIPAIYRILKDGRRNMSGQVLIEIEDESSIMPLDIPTGMTLKWFYRSSDQSSLMLDEILSLRAPADTDFYYWFAGEKQTSRQLKEHFKENLKLDKSQFYAASYWKKPLSQI